MASYEVPLNMLLGEGDNSFPLKKEGGGMLTSQRKASHLFALSNGLHRSETDMIYDIKYIPVQLLRISTSVANTIFSLPVLVPVMKEDLKHRKA